MDNNIEKKDNEPNYYYNIRKIFIKLLKPNTAKKIELYTMYSNIFINIFFYKCRYQEKTEKFIYNFLKKHKKDFILQIKKNYPVLNLKLNNMY
jgi:hypothetical protein